MDNNTFDLLEKARVKKAFIARRPFVAKEVRKLAGRVGTVAYIETGEASGETLYSLMFADAEMTTGSFFANELERV